MRPHRCSTTRRTQRRRRCPGGSAGGSRGALGRAQAAPAGPPAPLQRVRRRDGRPRRDLERGRPGHQHRRPDRLLPQRSGSWDLLRRDARPPGGPAQAVVRKAERDRHRRRPRRRPAGRTGRSVSSPPGSPWPYGPDSHPTPKPRSAEPKRRARPSPNPAAPVITSARSQESSPPPAPAVEGQQELSSSRWHRRPGPLPQANPLQRPLGDRWRRIRTMRPGDPMPPSIKALRRTLTVAGPRRRHRLVGAGSCRRVHHHRMRRGGGRRKYRRVVRRAHIARDARGGRLPDTGRRAPRSFRPQRQGSGRPERSVRHGARTVFDGSSRNRHRRDPRLLLLLPGRRRLQVGSRTALSSSRDASRTTTRASSRAGTRTSPSLGAAGSTSKPFAPERPAW
jgi:hypothetical protein